MPQYFRSGARVILILLLCQFAYGEDWTTTDGKIYKAVKVIKSDAASVTILDSDGGASVPLANLPPDLQKRFNYNASQAAAVIEEQTEAAQADLNAVSLSRERRISGVQIQYDRFTDTTATVFGGLSTEQGTVYLGWKNDGNKTIQPEGVNVLIKNAPAGKIDVVHALIDGEERTPIQNFDVTDDGTIRFALNYESLVYLAGAKTIEFKAGAAEISLTPDEVTLLHHFVAYVRLLPSAVTTAKAEEQSDYSSPYTFKTLAGLAGTAGTSDGVAGAARLNNPSGVAVDSHGNVYAGDSTTIRKITPDGVVSTLAGKAGVYGNSDGTGSAAQFDQPVGVAVDANGNVYVADSGNYNIRKITAAGVVTTLAGTTGTATPHSSKDGKGTAARFYDPVAVAVDAGGNVYVADSGNCTIRKVTPDGFVTTLAGLPEAKGCKDGSGSEARFNLPGGIAVDATGNIFVADSEAVRKITPAGVVNTLAGSPGHLGCNDGTGSGALFTDLTGIAVDANGKMYVTDVTSTIRAITSDGVVSTLAGSPKASGSADGTGVAALFNGPTGVAVDANGNVYVADTGNNTIRVGTPMAH